MKKIIILSLFLVGSSSLFAKDISIRIVNENDFPITIMAGAISNKDNAYSDDEIVQKRNDLNITAMGRPLASGKKTQFNKLDLSGSSIIIVFGMNQGGGRTNIFRYRVKDLDKELDLTFEKVKIYKSNNSYINIAEGLAKTEDLGSYFLTSKKQLTGNFVFYNITAETLGEVYVADRINEIEIKIGEKVNNSISDLLFKNAVPAYMNVKGVIVRAIPPNDPDVYNEVIIPGLEKSAEIFGSNTNKFITWKISGSGSVNVIYKDNSYFRLFSTSNVTDRTVIMDKLMKDINETGTSAYHLFFITNVHRTDSLVLIDKGMRKIEESELIEENDLITPNGNFRLDGDNKTVFLATNLINDVQAIDITPILCYRAIIQGKFSNTLTSAQNCIEVYKYIGGFVELPDLDDKTLSIGDPAYTITRMKEVMSDPNILASIEAKLISQTPASISIKAMKAAQIKWDARNK